MKTTRPVALLDPDPRSMEIMFRPEAMKELTKLIDLSPGPGEENYQKPTSEEIDKILPEAEYVIGQTDLPRKRLEAAPKLRAIFNVESNFLPNIDYEYCFANNIKVLTVSPVFANAVAEMGLGMALSLARRIPQGHIDFLAGTETYGLESNEDALLLSELPIGIVGFGDLGRALLKILKPFGRQIHVFDPWLPERSIVEAGAVPAPLETILEHCRAIFVVAAVTSENQGFIDKKALGMIQDDSIFVLLSRAGVVDFDAMTNEALSGRLRIATDVWPDEPAAAGTPLRKARNAVLSAHRAGALYSCFHEMGDRVLEDIKLLNRGLAPVSCKAALFETVTKMRSQPVSKS